MGKRTMRRSGVLVAALAAVGCGITSQDFVAQHDLNDPTLARTGVEIIKAAGAELTAEKGVVLKVNVLEGSPIAVGRTYPVAPSCYKLVRYRSPGGEMKITVTSYSYNAPYPLIRMMWPTVRVFKTDGEEVEATRAAYLFCPPGWKSLNIRGVWKVRGAPAGDYLVMVGSDNTRTKDSKIEHERGFEAMLVGGQVVGVRLTQAPTNIVPSPYGKLTLLVE